jgi:hypothetical protein
VKNFFLLLLLMAVLLLRGVHGYFFNSLDGHSDN